MVDAGQTSRKYGAKGAAGWIAIVKDTLQLIGGIDLLIFINPI